MSEIKWIKICVDLNRNKKIKRIRKLPEGNNIVLIWVMLLLQAGESNRCGGLFLTETMPFTVEDLAIEFDFDLNIMKLALITLEKFEMIQIFDDIFYIKNWQEYQSIDGLDKIREQTRLRVQKHRQNQKLLNPVTKCNVTCNADVTHCNATEVDIEVDIEKDIDDIYIKDISIPEDITTVNRSSSISPKNFSEDEKQKEVSPETYFEQEIGRTSSTVLQQIGSFVDDGLEPQLIKKAIDIACERNERSWSYIRGILNNCVAQGVKTIQAFDQKEKDFKNKKSKGPPGNKNFHVAQENNYPQRQYDDPYFESLIDNVNSLIDNVKQGG